MAERHECDGLRANRGWYAPGTGESVLGEWQCSECRTWVVIR